MYDGRILFMSGVAFIPIIGWGVSGAYFTVDQTVGRDKVMGALHGIQKYNESSKKEGCNYCILPIKWLFYDFILR
jgi:hypothetical protein